MKLGDNVVVNMTGPMAIGNSLKIGEGATITLAGRLIGETLDNYVIELASKIGDASHIEIPKAKLTTPPDNQEARILLTLSALVPGTEAAEDIRTKLTALVSKVVEEAWKPYGKVTHVDVQVL